MKKYNFTDKFNNEYNFENYIGFSKFWFNQPRHVLISFFPVFKKLNYLAVNSKETRKKI